MTLLVLRLAGRRIAQKRGDLGLSQASCFGDMLFQASLVKTVWSE
jgi:hypothetical protein